MCGCVKKIMLWLKLGSERKDDSNTVTKSVAVKIDAVHALAWGDSTVLQCCGLRVYRYG